MAMNDGGPAFPTHVSVEPTQGMSLRDYIATAAMQGFITSNMWSTAMQQLAETAELNPTQILARTAYEMADNMLAARSAE